MITKDLWDKVKPKSNPFLNYHFLDSLESTGCTGQDAGWDPLFLPGNNCALMTFRKSHSYGEYIFDWGWAEAYQRYGVDYYPKLTSLIPFTPVTCRHFLMPEFDKVKADLLLKAHDEELMSENLSSAHFLFLPPHETEIFESNNYLIRESIQYHFLNEGYKDFDDLLSSFKTKKAKTIRKERLIPGVKIKRYTGNDLNEEHARRMYRYYISTIANKNSYDYLKESFFINIFRKMPENILYIEASLEDAPIAASLFFYDHEKLYGRYWGSDIYRENLHFELCYYQGIDFCLEKKLSMFEAGAQGEHKVLRGFRPVTILSAHKIKHDSFREAIRDFIEVEKKHIASATKKLTDALPFKAGHP